MTAWYNEIDPYCAGWLRNLIAENLIAPGVVDERPIQDVRPVDLVGFTQCHFFAGLGGWSRALRLAAWPDHRPVWTGSCPCQPFSTAGARRGFADERHLWPFWHHLISVCRPPTIFGEQVARAADWQRLVHGDLEALGYAVGALPIEAASVGAPHLRDRFWFVASDCGAVNATNADGQGEHALAQYAEVARASQSLPHARGAELRQQPGGSGGANGQSPSVAGDDGATGHGDFWAAEPGICVVAHGVPARVAKLRALGNAIVPACAATFIAAFMSTTPP